MGRLFKALDTQFRGEKLTGDPSKFLVLADSKKSPKFSKAFPKKAEVQVVKSDADVKNVLGAVLGVHKLKSVKFKLGKLRQFVEYWEPSRRYEGEPGAGGGGSPSSTHGQKG